MTTDLLSDIIEAFRGEEAINELMEPSLAEKEHRLAILEAIQATRESLKAISTLSC